ncbi:MAG: succinylglutamate desuccinylase/aspartoacylase family protein [Alphaproteobacteria bacterium]
MSRTRIASEVDFDKDGKQHGFLRLPFSTHASAYGWIAIPISCIKRGEGPTVLLVSGNHGDEYEGQVALMKLTRRLEPADVSGRIIILSAANFPAALAGRRVSPIDGGNLNRSFPGNPDGSVTQMIAHYIETVLLPKAQLLVDLHSGGSSLMYIPSGVVRLVEDRAKFARLKELLALLGAPISFAFAMPQGEDRTLSAAADRAGVLHLGSELGGSGTVTPQALSIAEAGLARVLMAAGVLARPLTAEPAGKTRFMAVRGAAYFVYAPDSGVFEPYVDLGAEVAAGDAAGAIHFPDTPWREPTLARFTHAGLVICKRMPGKCARGDCLFHLATDMDAG